MNYGLIVALILMASGIVYVESGLGWKLKAFVEGLDVTH